MEHKKVFYDVDKMYEIVSKLEQIKSDNSINEDMKVQLINALMDGLNDEVRREFSHFMRTTYDEINPIADPSCCTAECKGKVALVEFTNIQYSYCRSLSMFAMISYMLTRCESYDNKEDKPAIQRFMQEVFGGDSDKYLGTIYDLFYLNNKAKHADFIPDFDISILGDCVPSIDQWMNFMKYSDAKFAELRALTTGLIGVKPSYDAIIHVHGVFDSISDPGITTYRNANSDKINTMSELIPIPIGKTWLLDKYKEFTAGTVLYNPSEPELEILHTNRKTVDMNSNAMFKKRVKNLKGRMTDTEIDKIKKYRKEIDTFRKSAPTEVKKVDQRISKLKTKIDRIHEKNTKDNEVITNVITIDKQRGVSVETCATIAD